MIFNYKLVETLRKKRLKVSREELSRNIFSETKGKINIVGHRISRLESGLPTKISPNELGAIFKSLGENPGSFWESKEESDC